MGFFESGHWPCALVVTHAILRSDQRALGNSILQSGASIGAIITPVVINQMVYGSTSPDAWRPPFLVIGSVGLLWVIAWFAIIRPGTIQSPQVPSSGSDVASDGKSSLPSGSVIDSIRKSRGDPVKYVISTAMGTLRFGHNMVMQPKFWALFVMVVCINSTWQLTRAWLPKFLREGRAYEESTALYFMSVYYVATDVGCLLAGAGALWLARRGMTAHSSRLIVYGVCCLLSALTILAAQQPAGPLLLAILLFIGAGTLGLFPCYYSFTQEIDAINLGKITGLLSFLGWLVSSQLQSQFGKQVDATKSFDLAFAYVGLAPIIGLAAMLILWPKQKDAEDTTAAL